MPHLGHLKLYACVHETGPQHEPRLIWNLGEDEGAAGAPCAVEEQYRAGACAH